MPLEDLELEFEDEEESKKKKDALHVDVDLQFSTEEVVKPRQSPVKQEPVAAAQVAAPSSAPVRPATQAGNSNPRIQPTAKIATQTVGAKVTPLPVKPNSSAPVAARPIATPKVQGSMALADQVFTEDVNEEVLELREKVQKLEVESQVKIGIAEFKAEFMSDVLSDMKLLDHQVTQILSKINAKHPDAKNEVMMIKKLLTDFASKKRK